MAQKILFYGNCQLGVLCVHLKQYTSYEIIDCKDYGLVPFWADSELFAVWSKENFDRQDELVPKILDAVNKCDIFIFQHYKNREDRPIELTTEYLVNNNPNCLPICIPSFWYTGYLSAPKIIPVNPVIYELYNNFNYPAKVILDFLQTSTDLFIKEMIHHEHNVSIQELEKRFNNESKKYINFIDCIDYVKLNFDKKILAYNHSHPSIHYFNFLLEKLNTEFKFNINELFNKTSLLPGGDYHISYNDLYYFTDYFQNINDFDLHDNFLTTKLNLETVQKQVQYIENSKVVT